MTAAPKWMLFVCTGNYYRSRYAEAVFNHFAESLCLSWAAFSRGLNIHAAPDDELSPYTREALQRLGIPLAYTGPSWASDPPRREQIKRLNGRNEAKKRKKVMNT